MREGEVGNGIGAPGAVSAAFAVLLAIVLLAIVLLAIVLLAIVLLTTRGPIPSE